MQDIFIRIIFGILILNISIKLYYGTRKALEEIHIGLVLPLILLILTTSYFVGGLLIK